MQRLFSPRKLVIGVALLAGICSVGAGCDSTPSGPTFRERQDAALKDPMNYKPADDHPVSGPTSKFDRDGFNRDMKSVFNP